MSRRTAMIHCSRGTAQLRLGSVAHVTGQVLSTYHSRLNDDLNAVVVDSITVATRGCFQILLRIGHGSVVIRCS